jgi:hypothetical protein
MKHARAFLKQPSACSSARASTPPPCALLRPKPDLKDPLPRLLWMYPMGLIFFWVFDRSAQQKQTCVLLEKSLPIVVRLIRIAGLPLMRPVRKMVVELVEAAVSG